MEPRVVMHVDFDYFYAQCEEIRNPLLSTKPVCVCVYSDRGEDAGAIATANYIAREYGVKSGMPITFAKRRLAKASDAEFIPVDFVYYSEISEKSMRILEEFADVFEYMGRDEAYLDVTKRAESSFENASRLAERIKNGIKNETGIGSSVGISPNKMISKIASDFEKPNGLTVVRPEQVSEFLEPFEARAIPGIGAKTERRLAALGLRTIGDIREKTDLFLLTKEFGRKSGTYIYNASRGVDEEPVRKRAPRIQYSRIVTLSEDSKELEILRKALEKTCADVHRAAAENGQMFKSVGIHIVQSDLSTRSRSRMLRSPTASREELQKNAEALLTEALKTQDMNIRRLGVMVTELSDMRGQSDITSFF